MLLVSPPEEAGVVKARPQNSLVPMADDAIGVAVRVEHGQKMRRQTAPGILHSKIFLMITHDRDQNFFRQLQKLRIEGAQDRRRPFSQVDYGVEQRFVFAPARAGNGTGGGVEILANLFLSLLATQDLYFF